VRRNIALRGDQLCNGLVTRAPLAGLIDQLDAVPWRVLGDPGQQRVQRLALWACQRSEDLLVDLPECVVERRKQLLTGLGELNDRAAAVGPVAAPLDQVPILETIEDRDHVGRVDAEQLTERLLRGGPAILEVLERQELTRTQAKWRDCLLDTTAHAARELRDQQD